MVIGNLAEDTNLLVAIGVVTLRISLLSRISPGVGVVKVVVAGPGGSSVVAPKGRIGAFLLLLLSALLTEVNGIHGILLFIFHGVNPG
jgi:hypothetical protein